ncbi:hypothetical protein JMM61_14145 [Rhodovulum sulfidophilum]|uniref:plasmid mobilization protein n=1 Tax=Rhodovulum sulfidophilum TaxID=35806 RepID=UPI0019277C35|nr:hypothetical protein [Rhodovulum sulfidophilum]MBL3586518.1 hypothetical protein [Rhodovulum sulfidophilum]
MTSPASDTTAQRTITMKVRVNEAESREIDRHARQVGLRKAEYLRKAALQGGGHAALSEMIGMVGLGLNQLEDAPANSLNRIARQLDEIIFLMRGTDR